MNCPFCGNEMQAGIISGDGRSKVYWEPKGEKLAIIDKIAGKGMIDAEYSLTKFKIHGDYCANCRKMIFDTNV